MPQTLWVITHGQCRLTTQAQRPGGRGARIATTTLPPGSLQRMVRRHFLIGALAAVTGYSGSRNSNWTLSSWISVHTMWPVGGGGMMSAFHAAMLVALSASLAAASISD